MSTVTIKNIPDDLYENLKRAAAANHRSINGEVIVCIERAVGARKIDEEEVLQRARRLRELTLRTADFQCRARPRPNGRDADDRRRYKRHRLSAHCRRVFRASGAGPCKDPHWVAPLLWRSEMRNVLALYLRRRRLTPAEAQRIMEEAQRLMEGQEYEVPSARVFEEVARGACSAYDCEYVALARLLGVRLVTCDEQILSQFPEVATALEKFVAG